MVAAASVIKPAAAAHAAPASDLPKWRRWYMVTILFVLYLFSSADKLAIAIVTEPLKADFHLSDADLGLLTGLAFSIPFALVSLPMGFLLDRYSRVTILTLMLALWSGLTLACAMATGFASLALARMGVGAAETSAVPGSLSLIADVFPPHQRSTPVSIFYGGGGLGAMFGLIFGGWVLTHFDWRAVFLAVGVPGLLLALVARVTIREPIRGFHDGLSATAATVRPPITAPFKVLKTNIAVRYAIVAITLATGANFAITVWSTSLLIRVFSLSALTAASYSGSAVGIGLLVGSILGGICADRFAKGDPQKLAVVPAVGSLGGFVFAIMFSQSNGLGLSLAGLFGEFIFSGVYVGSGFSLMVAMSPPDQRGSILSLTKLAAILFGTGMIPLLVGMISDFVGGHNSLRPAIAIDGVFFLFAALCFYLAGARSQRSPLPSGVDMRII